MKPLKVKFSQNRTFFFLEKFIMKGIARLLAMNDNCAYCTNQPTLLKMVSNDAFQLYFNITSHAFIV